MKIKKGKLIYIILSMLFVGLLFVPSSLSIFKLPIKEIVNSSNSFLYFLPDIVAVCLLLFGYVALRQFYKKHSIYIKLYPIYVLVIFMLWTIAIRFK